MEAGSWKWEVGRQKMEAGEWKLENGRCFAHQSLGVGGEVGNEKLEDALPVEAFLIDEALA